jgi:hypothetical protein
LLQEACLDEYLWKVKACLKQKQAWKKKAVAVAIATIQQ